jgi:hypothetical protein
VIVPPGLVVDAATAEHPAERMTKPRKPTAAMRALFSKKKSRRAAQGWRGGGGLMRHDGGAPARPGGWLSLTDEPCNCPGVLARSICVVSFLLMIGCKGGDRAPELGAAAAPREGTRQNTAMTVVRLSRGSFPPEKYEEVRARLDAAKEKLVPAIRALHGCLHYWAAIDQTSSTMINVSLWETLADARQMETLQPMLALAGEFVALGVTFERPITNSQMLWEVPLGPP